MTTIRRVLIANRGEIAVRVARTCRRLGIETVAVFSDADRRAPHVHATDAAFRIGPPEPRKSYLDVDRILDATRLSGADAIHPGYGFLSENAAFAERCAAASITFIGPRAEAIRAMGSKESSRRLGVELGVPVVPGYHGGEQEDASLAREAARVGFPLLVKASAGGGGKGIRIVRSAEALSEALATARREAASAFGDPTLILERFVERGRHVEVQVLGDRHGNVVHLLDRECSAQRHHQKVVEEAPAPNLPAELRADMRRAAVRVAAAIGYDSAGTVEFLVDAATSEFFFLEMNTRLQVEHPTTELVTGLDLVELQIRVARDERLPETLRRVEANGSAIEVRLCAERPDAGFLPATGEVERFQAPTLDGLRVDSGIEDGSVVGAYYDSMLAKLIAHGADRDEARRKLAASLRRTVLAGVESNLDYLREILESSSFAEAKITTRHLETGFAAERLPADPAEQNVDMLAAALTHVLEIERTRLKTRPVPWDRLGAWRVTRGAGGGGTTVVAIRTEDGDRTDVALSGARGRYQASLREESFGVEVDRQADGTLRMLVEGTLRSRVVVIADGVAWVSGGDRHRRLALLSRDEQSERSAGAAGDLRDLSAPFPGLITQVEVAPGDRVEAGAVLVVMEAMKMVHTLRAAGTGVVRRVAARSGTTVPAGQLLVEFGESEA